MQRVTTRHSNERNPMTTKAEFRAAVRRRLDDVPVAGLWDDATLDDAMADALSRYGVFAPQEERSTVAVSDGAMSFAVTGLERRQAIRRGIDPGASVIAPGRAEDGDEPGQGWRWWAGEIRLAKPARAGSWIVEWHRPRLLPATDSGVVPILAGDDGAVSLIAAGSALRRRAVEEAKRGGRGADGLMQLAKEWEAAGLWQARARGRRVSSFTAGTR